MCLATQFEALLLPLLLLLFLFLLNVSGFGKIVVVGKAFFSNASSGGVVVGQGGGLRGNDFTEARAPK